LELSDDPVVPFLGIYLNECKSIYNTDYCTPIFIAVLFTIAKLWNQPTCPSMDKWIKKVWDIYTMEYYSYIKKN
jgi:hypothetical protein